MVGISASTAVLKSEAEKVEVQLMRNGERWRLEKLK
jgi:hypothetical protein